MVTNTTAGGQDPNSGKRFTRWRRFALMHSVLGNTGILATGTAAGQAIAIAVPVVTAKLFTPKAFGEFALFSSIAEIFAVIATLRYNLAIVLPETDNGARQLARLATRANPVVSLTATLSAFLYRDTVAEIQSSPTLATWFPLVGLSVFCAAQISIWRYWFNRKRQYRVIALNRFTQSVGTSDDQLGFGLGGMRFFLGLLCGSFIGLAWALFSLGRQSSELRRRPGTDAPTIRQVACRHHKMPLLDLPNALVDAVRINGIQMLIGVIALSALGQFNLAWRVLQAPITLLNGAIAQVFLGRMSRAKCGELTGLAQVVIKRTMLFTVPPFTPLQLLAPWLTPLVFGSQWVKAGLITHALVPWLVMNLVTSPISNVFVVTSHQPWVLLHAIVPTVIPLAWLFFSPLELLETLQVLSLMMALMLRLLLVLAGMVARAYDHEVPSRGAGEASDAAPDTNQENGVDTVETKPEIERGTS